MKSIAQWLLIALVMAASQQASAQESISGARLLQDLAPAQVDSVINSYKGDKTVLVNVWATWCGPCVEEFPSVVKLQRMYPRRLEVIFICADFPEDRDRALAFLRKQGVDWPTWFKTGQDQDFINALWPEWSGALPFTRIVNKWGRTTAYWESSADFDKFHRYVKQALNP